MALCNKYHEKETSPILDKRLNLKSISVLSNIVVIKIIVKKYISKPEYLSLIKILKNINKVIKENELKFFSLKLYIIKPIKNKFA